MLELTSQVALSVGAARRREEAQETMRAVRASNGGIRHAAGLALVATGRRISGELPVAARKMSISGDCV